MAKNRNSEELVAVDPPVVPPTASAETPAAPITLPEFFDQIEWRSGAYTLEQLAARSLSDLQLAVRDAYERLNDAVYAAITPDVEESAVSLAEAAAEVALAAFHVLNRTRTRRSSAR